MKYAIAAGWWWIRASAGQSLGQGLGQTAGQSMSQTGVKAGRGRSKRGNEARENPEAGIREVWGASKEWQLTCR